MSGSDGHLDQMMKNEQSLSYSFALEMVLSCLWGAEGNHSTGLDQATKSEKSWSFACGLEKVLREILMTNSCMLIHKMALDGNPLVVRGNLIWTVCSSEYCSLYQLLKCPEIPH